MARPTAGGLTGAGYAQVGTSTKYTKTTGTATALCDIGNGNIVTGVAGVIASGVTPITPADLATQIASLAAAGAAIAANASVGANGLQYYGLSI